MSAQIADAGLPTAMLVSEVALLQRRLAGRAAIEQAKGVLMARLNCTAVEALDLLTAQSRLAGHHARTQPPELGAALAAASTVAPGTEVPVGSGSVRRSGR